MRKTAKPFPALLLTFLLAGAAIAFSGCSKPGPGGLYFENFITSYQDAPSQEEVEVTIRKDYSPKTPDYGQITLLFRAIESYYYVKPAYRQLNLYSSRTPEDYRRAEVFDSLARAHNDVYERYSFDFFDNCLFRPIISIDVVSDTDYDPEHPAGVLLNDLLDIKFGSAEDYLLSGYVREKYLGQTTRPTLYYSDIHNQYIKEDDISSLQESLTEFNQIHRKLVSFGFRFVFTQGPAAAASHSFTITYRDEGGAVLSATTEPVEVRP